ncbi:hypothetical protein BRPE64_ECDS00260 (plasmid) [Caballeronia insecticola]|uniref:Uncharacterized protein n=1 Tax=Caballeronia insecticola TaxID=758793 RepID=R4WUF1_9BURK|nr:hypothetical protein BRPE64_ECDS00260 [Caballeronia insecticola]
MGSQLILSGSSALPRHGNAAPYDFPSLPMFASAFLALFAMNDL